MPDRWLSNEDWEAIRRLKERSDHVWLELGYAPAPTDAHFREMQAIHDELSRIFRRYADVDSAPVA
jgi:hypothetical protein